MKIRYEAEIKDCSECGLFKCDWNPTRRYCELDQQTGEIEYPCQTRPCPIEIK